MSLYSRIASQNIRKNYRFFIPRILTEAGLLACFYIVFTLVKDQRMSSVKGGDYLSFFMGIGTVVIGILSIILMLYTNSFLMKQRKREFGLYNVLGMEKRHVNRVLFFESAYSAVIGIVFGILLGILLYKLCSLLICKLLGVESVLGFYYISPTTVLPAALGFLLIDLVTYLINCISISRMKPVDLMASAEKGEREPKVRWVMLILGILCLGGGYYLAVSTRDPLDTLILFFIAVILVMFGTYFLFVTGTTYVLQRLKKNKNYYYNKQHMTAVSGLLYRMKQNAVGLASICILATGVLVMISTTVSLYAGTEETLAKNYPQDLYLIAGYNTKDDEESNIEYNSIPAEVLTEIVADAAESNGVEIKETIFQKYLKVAYLFQNGICESERNIGILDSFVYFNFITAKAYQEITGDELPLAENEIAVAVLTATGDPYHGDTITIGGDVYNVTEYLPTFPLNTSTMSSLTSYGVVVANENILNRIYEDQKSEDSYDDAIIERLSFVFADRNAAMAVGNDLNDSIIEGIDRYVLSLPYNGYKTSSINLDSVWEASDSVYGMYGTFLFLGILLGIVCLFATALIIYYKQISEGYEDRSRYQIMEKVGMSQKEVRSSIKSQILLVFFLPLVVAGVHICFAFPMLTKLLKLLLLSKTSLFMLCTLITFIIFALVYVVIYAVTAKTYYKIVH